MGISKPDIKLSRNDKHLLAILGRHLIGTNGFTDNLPEKQIPLTDSEAEELLVHFEYYVASKSFQMQKTLVEGLFLKTRIEDRNLKNIYIDSKKLRGRINFMRSWEWKEYKHRLLGQEAIVDVTRSHPRLLKPMGFEYFLKMEESLFENLKLDSRVRELLMNYISLHKKQVIRVRDGSVVMPTDTFNSYINETRKSIVRSKVTNILSKICLKSLAILVADGAAFGTTRDWNVLSSFSMMAGVAGYIYKTDKDE
ncbi:MAG: hypothetical protein KAR62_00280 [Sphingomonadales bacterium]|nr:hypothetical protein [Sphingomonadales bacterium]